jgi:hypothetical protein
LPAVFLTFVTGCKKDDFLNVQDLSAISSNVTWSSESTADLVLNDIYENLPDLNSNVFDPLDNWSDNSMCGFSWAPSASVLRDMTTLNPSSDVSVSWNGNGPQWLYWSRLYGNVRKCNVFISGLSASNLPTDYKNQRLGEAYTLRAFFYHYLWMFFGGVPIITRPDSRITDGDSVFHHRATFDETYQFIISDLDSAVALLPANNGNDGGGRVTKGAALTLKAWCQLFYASPLYNTSNDKSRWAAAAATCKLVEGMGYTLYPKYDELFFATGNNNNEGILYREYLKTTKPSNIIGFEGPNTIGSLWLSWGGMNPTQDLVDDYAMANGMAITDQGSGYDPQNPYKNREPRFYQSILYSGSTFDGYLYTTYSGQLNGVSANNPIDLSDANDFTNTGYAMRKRMDTTTDFFGGINSWQNYYFFRYADVLLMYAEAQNEAVGPDATVYSALDQLRARAGIPGVSQVYPQVSQDKMREIIRRERRVELAFEGKRYWDLLRWKTAEVNINRPLKAMHITAQGSTLTYQVVDAARGDRKFDASKNYVLPIPQSAISRNPSLIQNSNY